MSEKPLWMREFGPAYDVPEAITREFYDDSYGNDICPSFVLNADAAQVEAPRLWVNHQDPELREHAGAKRFMVTTPVDDTAVYEGDDLDTALRALKATHAAWQAAMPGNVKF